MYRYHCVPIAGLAVLCTPTAVLATYGKGGPASTEIVLFAIGGRAFLNRLSAFLLGAVGGTIGAGMFHNMTGAAIGFIVGGVIAISPPYRRSTTATSADV
jgi:hypothetical protein